MPKQLVISPCLNNFLYDIWYNSPEQVKNDLPRKYRVASKNSRTVQSFIGKCSQEEKQELLTLLGVEWLMVFFDRGFPQKKYLREIFGKYKDKENNKNTMVTDAIKDRIYVTADTEFIHLLGLMSKIENHHTYPQNLLLHKSGYHIMKWQKSFKESKSIIAEENEAAAKYLIKTALNASIATQVGGTLFGLIQNDVLILMYLYTLRHLSVTVSRIHNGVSDIFTKNAITNSLNRLYKGNLVRKSVSGKEYTISALGMMRINDVLEYIIKSNEF